jgi:hypothetical protein
VPFSEIASGPEQAEIAAHDIHQIGAVGAIEHGESGAQRQHGGVLAQ